MGASRARKRPLFGKGLWSHVGQVSQEVGWAWPHVLWCRLSGRGGGGEQAGPGEGFPGQPLEVGIKHDTGWGRPGGGEPLEAASVLVSGLRQSPSPSAMPVRAHQGVRSLLSRAQLPPHWLLEADCLLAARML